MKVVLFRNHPKEGTYPDDYRALTQHLVETVSALPGFVSVEEFRGAGGEVLILAKFESDQALSPLRKEGERSSMQTIPSRSAPSTATTASGRGTAASELRPEWKRDYAQNASTA